MQNKKYYIISSFQENRKSITNFEQTKKLQKFIKLLHFSLKTNYPIHAQLLLKPKWIFIRGALLPASLRNCDFVEKSMELWVSNGREIAILY